ncbi:MAG: hypothetical protein U5K36_03360 [Roseovarius sp.]|nr:hypothetical protein [Roseovarius sp.]
MRFIKGGEFALNNNSHVMSDFDRVFPAGQAICSHIKPRRMFSNTLCISRSSPIRAEYRTFCGYSPSSGSARLGAIHNVERLKDASASFPAFDCLPHIAADFCKAG